MCAGVVSAWEQEKLEARKMLAVGAAESHTSGSIFKQDMADRCRVLAVLAAFSTNSRIVYPQVLLFNREKLSRKSDYPVNM